MVTYVCGDSALKPKTSTQSSGAWTVRTATHRAPVNFARFLPPTSAAEAVGRLQGSCVHEDKVAESVNAPGGSGSVMTICPVPSYVMPGSAAIGSVSCGPDGPGFAPSQSELPCWNAQERSHAVANDGAISSIAVNKPATKFFTGTFALYLLSENFPRAGNHPSAVDTIPYSFSLRCRSL